MNEERPNISINGSTIGAMTTGDGSHAYGTVNVGGAADPSAGSAEEPVEARVSRTLVVVVADVERDAVLARVSGANGAVSQRRYLASHTVYELGPISATEVLLAQIGQGTVTPDSGAAAATELIQQLRPDHVILTGICYGLKEDNRHWQQRLGDVVVASELRLIGHHRVSQVAGQSELRHWSRGGAVHPSPMLLDRFRSAALDWDRRVPVHIGPFVSESVLVDSFDYRERLRAEHPEALAGEMEGSGVYAAALRGKVDWALVKAISDWGYRREYAAHPMAADNAASFLVHMMRVGGLDPVSTAEGPAPR